LDVKAGRHFLSDGLADGVPRVTALWATVTHAQKTAGFTVSGVGFRRAELGEYIGRAAGLPGVPTGICYVEKHPIAERW
jgi:hypothetical protein